MQISKTVSRIADLDKSAQKLMAERLDSLTKPLHSLGRLEDLAIQLAGITGSAELAIDPSTVILMAADHGVAAEGVSAFPAEVTVQMVHNFVTGGAGINVLARAAGATVTIVDIGVQGELDLPGLVSRKIRHGTENMVHGPAMSRSEAIAAIEVGMETARKAVGQGAKLIGLGEMGIGNTTASSALLAVLGQVSVEEVAGVGTGINSMARQHKIDVIRKAIECNQPNFLDPLDSLAKVGGLEIAGLTGVILEAAAARTPIVVDGFITAVAALIAVKMAPLAARYLIASHQSVEPGHRVVNEMLGLQPLLSLDLRLGEGSGAALAIPIVRAATRIANEMSTFQQANVSGSTDGTVPGAAQHDDSDPAANNSVAAIEKRHEFDSVQKAGVYKAIYERRDIRAFIRHPVEEHKLQRILETAHHAPSVGFMQPWNFIVIRSDDIKAQLHEIVDREVRVAGQYFEGRRAELYGKLKVQGILDAPVTLCVTSDPTRDGDHVLGRNTIPETDVYSVVCAIENLWLAARAEGLGVGWVSFYKKQDVSRILNIPPYIVPVALLSVGYTHTFHSSPVLETVGWGNRRELSELVFADVWGKKQK
ncbi:MAG: nicotinate-nucleotide--dimethylbenzimidazole phosphoribosyltransferase [Bacilli bacterium]